MNDNSLVFWFSTLLIANYSILLNGDVYSMGISWTCSILNDFKVLEKFIEFVEKSQSSDYDNITLYFAKLYYSLDLIDDIYCLGMGTQKSINQNTLIQFLHANIRFFVKEDESIKSGMALFKNAPLLMHMINVRDQYIYEGKYSKPIPIQQQTSDDQFAAHFMTLVSEKYDLINYLLEINHFIVHDSNKHHDSDELYETLMDYNLKLIRLVKKLSSSIMNFANFIGTSTTGSAAGVAATTATTSSPTSPSLKPALVNPLLNISIGQLFKLIKLIKLIIDSLTTSKQSSTDLENRLTKINNDLSISFNLLNLNLVNLQLGTKSSLIIKKKVGDYKFNFNKPTNITTTEQSLNSYIQEFTNTILPFIQQENRHGWY
ncbi:uncharacterized protein SPAPADRAFT_58593 [Spathaspora passalidarum NRRL Y-27907]|uniref:Uncharacterized protein n=1 Tax=Spathaspora passalidarum (strain NRRL Y-27907 / 11-Y1) TaxID=619300 RepID=G3AGN1_SPAPN|nr:uncharacterized protein SPAPADRAFT_58593 [Spathaspora passalidarum NRRL Y-27907]EGW35370.1 hypothetical protein SPAPADRAFT_58593 [Spathaspora passalidarum NRRL Y-27907]